MQIPKFFDRYFDVAEFAPNLRAFIMSELMAPHRHYHGIGHHALMLRCLVENPKLAQVQITTPQWFRELIAATFFHDIVYDVHRTDNEELSAVTARLWLPSNLDRDFVIDCILATKSHDIEDFDSMREAAINRFLRADLMIFWADSHQYAWYADGVRKEYAHVPNEVYRVERAKVLKKMRANIHPYVSARKSIQMSTNIDWELNQLNDGVFDLNGVHHAGTA